jgi:alkylation response protein AidB-like acyl-CoA dehydrogenase
VTVDLNLGAEQRQIIASVKDVLADRFPLSRFRDARGGDHDKDALAQVAELGWLGLGIEEQFGGAGFALVDDVLLFRELGHHLVTPAVMAGSLGAHLALACGNTGLAADIASGAVRLSLANALRGDEGDRPTTTYVIYDGADADYLLSWDATEFACFPASQLIVPQPGRCIDRTVSLRRASGVATGNLTLTDDAARKLRRRADLLIAAQLLGMTEGALDLSVEYAKLRRQFGQPIGSFQAIKHRCADMKVRAKVLASLVLMAALAEQGGHPDAALQIAAARLLASRYAIENAGAGIQIHGAMGFSAECDAHLFLLRAHLLENVGSTAAEREVEMASLPQ